MFHPCENAPFGCGLATHFQTGCFMGPLKLSHHRPLKLIVNRKTSRRINDDDHDKKQFSVAFLRKMPTAN